MADILSEMVSKLSLNADDFTKGIEKATGSATGFDSFMDGLASKIFSPAGAIAAVTAIGTASFAAAIMYDDASDTIAAKTGQTGEALASLERSFDEVFKDVPSNAKDVAEAIGSLANRLQLSGPPLEALSVQFLNLARVHKEQLGPLIDATADAFRRWDVATEDQAAMLDYFYNVAAKANTTVTSLASQITGAQAAFSAAGMDIKQTAELLGSLSLAGVDVEKVMPAIKKSIMEMAKAGVDPAEGFPALVAQIKNATSETQALEIGARAFGTRGGAELVAVIRAGSLDASAFSASLKGATQSINDLTDATDDFQQEWEKSWHKIQSVLQGFGSWMMKNLKADIIHLNSVFSAFSKGIELNVQWLDKVAKKLGVDGWVTTTAEAAAATQKLTASVVSVKPPAEAAGAAFQTAAEKAKALAAAEKALKAEMDLMEAVQKRDRDNFIFAAEARKKTEEQTKKNIEAESKLRAEIDALAESARNAQPDMAMWADTNERIAAWYKQEPLSPPFLIDDELIAKGKALGPDMAKGAKEATGAWQEFGKEVSTILTNFAQDVGKNLMGLVLGTDRNKFNEDLESQAADLRKNLTERTSEWEKYQADVAATMERLKAENAAGLAEELAALQSSLASQESEWASYQSTARARLDEQLGDLQDSLDERQDAFDAYADDVAATSLGLREKFAASLEEELYDLEKNLDERREAYDEFVLDTSISHGRNAEDLQESLADERIDTERNIADKTRLYQRDTDALRRKIAAEQALGSRANQSRIQEWQIELQQKEQDYNTYVQRQWDDYNEYASDQQRRYERETTDLNIELGRRTDDFNEYQNANTLLREQAVTDNATKLNEELTELQSNLAKKATELDAYKIAAATKAAELTAKYNEELAKQEADYIVARDKLLVEMDKLPAEYALDLAKELADLKTSLTDKALAYDAYKLEIEGKLTDLVDKHRTAWGDVKTFFGTTLTGMGEALTAWVTKYLVGELFLKFADLTDNILPGVANAIRDAFGDASGVVGGVTSSDLTGGTGGLGGAAGGIAGGAVSAWITAISSAVSAVTGVIGIFQTGNTNEKLTLVEENTRLAQLFLGGRADQGILGVLFSINEQLAWGPATKAVETIRDEMLKLGVTYINPSLDTLKTNTAAIRDAITGARPNVTINITGGTASAQSIADEVMAQLRLQMGIA
jgi:hypothetical protein